MRDKSTGRNQEPLTVTSHYASSTLHDPKEVPLEYPFLLCSIQIYIDFNGNHLPYGTNRHSILI